MKGWVIKKGLIAIVVLSGLSVITAKASETDWSNNVGVESGATAVDGRSSPISGTHKWANFVIHVREIGDLVEGAAVGGNCKGKDLTGERKLGTAGCARWKKGTGGWLNGECWIIIPRWDDSAYSHEEIMRIWGHELAHCVRGSWHK